MKGQALVEVGLFLVVLTSILIGIASIHKALSHSFAEVKAWSLPH